MDSDDFEVSDDTAKCRLDNFLSKVTRKRDPPLICEPPKQSPTKPVLPRRSRRQVAQPLSQVPTSKRGEVLIRRRLGLLKGPSTASGLAAYDKIFGGGDDLMPNEAAALDELFLATWVCSKAAF
jgi:hypothetical protein